MKRNILLTLILCLCAGIFSSCEKMFGDFLDKQPSNELTEKEVFSSWKNLTAYHFDTYNFLRNGLAPINNSWMDAASDLATTSYSWGGTRSSFNIGNYYAASGAPELTATWEHYYRAIRKCNTLLQRIDAVPLGPDDGPAREAEQTQFKAEARFLRAYFYWELCLRYGAVPIIEEPLDPLDQNANNFKRPESERECFQFILKELNECLPDLLTTTALTDVGRITKPINLALQSRIKLYLASPRYSPIGLATWADAAIAAKDFIDAYGEGQYKLLDTEGPLKSYEQVFIRAVVGDKENKEVIFFRNDPQGDWWRNEAPVGYGGNGGLSPSQNLVDMYDMANGTSPFSSYDDTGSPQYSGTGEVVVNGTSGYNDQSPYLNRDPRFYQTILHNGFPWWRRTIETFEGGADKPLGNANATPTGYYNKKYMSEASLPPHIGQTNLVHRDWIFIRYAEILLNYAEALNEVQGPSADVFNTLQRIRNRVGLTALLSARPDLQTKENLRKFIRKERTVELAFENHRVWDVKRWNVAEAALARPIYGMTITKNANNSFTYTRKVVQSRVFDSKMYLYPIPEQEVWKTGMRNNPGW